MPRSTRSICGSLVLGVQSSLAPARISRSRPRFGFTRTTVTAPALFKSARGWSSTSTQTTGTGTAQPRPQPQARRLLFSSKNMADVDTSLHASTSGAAAIYAELHSAPHALKLYGGWFCPFVQRAWITLHEKNVPHQYIEVNPYQKTPELLRLNPRGLVPTLAVPVPETVGLLSTGERAVADGSGPVADEEAEGGGDGGGQNGVGAGGVRRKPLYESAVICEYIDEAYASSGIKDARFGPGLLPPLSEPYARARCRLWIDHINGKIVPGFYRLLQHTPEKDGEYTLEEARAGFLGHIKTFVKEMEGFSAAEKDGDGGGGDDTAVERALDHEDDGPWFLGREFSLVDVMLAPWARRLFLIDHYKPGGVGIPAVGEGGAEEAVWARWRRWFGAITSRESVKDTWSDEEQYIAAYKRYAEDTTQSEVAQATRKRQRLP
ncbi:glutathione S-transferase [Microdochium trichocladiopsis]|uniref:Glutathione S-transferase n=1 Tax=Microdochium trichocladiopsis TaxID=1682393 RepID=A0A9P8YCE5_9PEZI|nr:glutathione S-transferase [Microdochium trichocladiopsis]KAH7033622.1 glutathione S-transferase [Microdochium trichocladiopsis]